MTNIEKIQNMTTEELTMFLNFWADDNFCAYMIFRSLPHNHCNYGEVKSWLEAEVEE